MFYTSLWYLFLAVFPIAILLPLWYIIVRKGDTDAEVKLLYLQQGRCRKTETVFPVWIVSHISAAHL